MDEDRPSRRWLAALLLLAALTPALCLLLSNQDIPQFGLYQDDGLLLINAQSLSEGQGFRILSLPGEPHQTKYQPLFPLLEAVWGTNLRAIAALQTLIFIAFVLVAAWFFRASRFSPLESAGLASMLALSPLVIYWAAIPTADYLFAVLVIATFLALDQGWLLAAGILTALAYLTKSAGLLIVPAVLFGLIRTQDWRRIGLFLLPVIPAVGGWMLWAHQHRAAPGHVVLAYYTDYLGYHLRSGGLAALPDIVMANAVTLCSAAGSLLVHDLAESLPGRFLSILVAAAAVTGGIRLARRTGRSEYPIFCALLTVVLCLWNFSPSVRLILPIAPLVLLGVYLEAQNCRTLVRQAIRGGGANRVVAWILMAFVLFGLVFAVQQNYTFIGQTIPGILTQSRQKSHELRTIHSWIAANLPATAVVMASEDTLLYLRTGRKSVRPVPNSVAFYRQDRSARLENFTHAENFESAFGITHILLGPGDLSTDFDAEDQREAIRLIRENPRHRVLHEQSGYTVLLVQPQM